MIELITTILPLLGVALGGGLTYWIQKDQRQSQLLIEEQKFNQEQMLLRLSEYSEILSVIRTSDVITRLGGDLLSFDVDLYQDEVRPTLYKKHYLLHKDIHDKVYSLDGVISRTNFDEELTRQEEQFLIRNYMELHDVIERDFQETQNLIFK